MRNYEPYKKMIVFVMSLFNILMLTAVFAFFWYKYFWSMMYAYSFYAKGNYLMIALYGALLVFFSKMYGALKIGQLRRLEVILSQYLSIFITNVFAYMMICLLAFRFVNLIPVLVMMVSEFVITTLWSFGASYLYRRIFKSWKLLLVYGDRSATDLVYKVEERRDKYAIHDAIHVNEGLVAIAEKAKDFEAVIIGDISARKRNDVLKFCYGNGIRAYVIPKISDVILMGSDRIHIFDTPFLLTKGYALSFDQRFAKRALDIIVAAIMLLLLFPVMLLAALAIKAYDKGSIFYKQVRCTKGGKEFNLIKFRSMIEDAESDGVARLVSKNDARITPVGAFMRATRIDELPQLINVLRGDMSLVGPRPERPEIIREYEKEMEEFTFRMRVKAGLTGFAQIYGKYNTVPYDKLKLDLFYIENYSVWLDIKLILMTIKTVLKKDSTEGILESQTTAKRKHSGKDVHQVIRGMSEQEK